MQSYQLNHLDQLESEAIFIIREAVAQFEKPVMLFSGGKDSIVMAHLAQKAFFPSKLPFPMLHIDTGHNFPETIEYRDKYVEKIGAKLEVASVQEMIDKGMAVEEKGANASRNAIQTIALLDYLENQEIDAAFGGGRRDEEKARAKERFFSHRDEFGHWDPKNQRPELWNIFNGEKNIGEHFRIFPLSNWTELDVWHYIKMEKIDLPNLYFSHEREVFRRNNSWLAKSDFIKIQPNEKLETKIVRFRTIGDATCTGAVESKAESIDDVINEVSTAMTTERGTRADDKRSETSMEDRKREGYF